MAIEWNEKLEIGIQEIDTQHKELFKIMNNLIEACNSGKGKEVVGNTLRFLKNYCIEHFKTEEKLMEKHNYPDLEKHKLQHYVFTQNIDKIYKDFEKDGPRVHIVILVNQLVVNWFINHIKKIDVLYGKHIKEHAEK